MSEKIYINLVPNPKYTEGSNLPVMVGPANPNAPEGKNWTIGVKMPDGDLVESSCVCKQR
jgi:hypothetical protein